MTSVRYVSVCSRSLRGPRRPGHCCSGISAASPDAASTKCRRISGSRRVPSQWRGWAFGDRTGSTHPGPRRLQQWRWATGLCLVGGGGGQGGFLLRTLVDGAGSYSFAHRAGLLPTELTGMWGWILLRSPHQGRRSPPARAPSRQRPGGPPQGSQRRGTALVPFALPVPVPGGF